MKRFVVTGGTGFIGTALVKALQEHGHEAIVACREGEIGRTDSSSIPFDLTDGSSFSNIRDVGADGVFHLAWSTVPATADGDPGADIITNVAGSVAFLQYLAEDHPVPILVTSSGGTVYGNGSGRPASEEDAIKPVGFYGEGKATFERYAAHFHARRRLDVRVARVSNPYGVGQNIGRLQGAVTRFTHLILNHEPIQVWGDGSQVRDYVHVDDVAAGLLAALEVETTAASKMPIWNLGSGTGTSLRRLIDRISEVSGVEANVEYLESRGFDVEYNVLDIARARSELGFAPRDLLVGLRDLVAALRVI